jgi:predicted flavoprotein YhiN
MKNADELIEQLSANTKNSWANTIRKNIKLDPKLFKIIKNTLSKDEFFNPKKLVETIKNFKLDLNDLNDLDKAISSAGGVSFSELDRAFRLKKYKKIHICGEMIDWEAPTGGFLIQGSLAIANRICTELK